MPACNAAFRIFVPSGTAISMLSMIRVVIVFPMMKKTKKEQPSDYAAYLFSNLARILEFPPVGVGDGSGYTDSDTGWEGSTVAGFAWSAMVADLLSLFVFYRGHRFFPEDINLIRPYFKDFYRTHLNTLTASIAFVRIDGDIPVARAILKTIIGNHALSFSKFVVRSF
jgi:hypothetical protein